MFSTLIWYKCKSVFIVAISLIGLHYFVISIFVCRDIIGRILEYIWIFPTFFPMTIYAFNMFSTLIWYKCKSVFIVAISLIGLHYFVISIFVCRNIIGRILEYIWIFPTFSLWLFMPLIHYFQHFYDHNRTSHLANFQLNWNMENAIKWKHTYT